MLALFASLVLKVPAAAKVIAISGTVYGLLEVVKKYLPQVSGNVAIALNIILATVGTVITVPAEQLYTTNTAGLLLMAAMGAAGIHGTVQNMSSPK